MLSIQNYSKFYKFFLHEILSWQAAGLGNGASDLYVGQHTNHYNLSSKIEVC